MLTSLAHVRPSGGLMVKNSNISKDQWHFLKGHIEAIVAMFDHSNYFKFLVILVKFIWSMNYCVFFYDFDCSRRSLGQSGSSELSISVRFLYVFLIFDRNPCQALAPPSACQMLCWRGVGGR